MMISVFLLSMVLVSFCLATQLKYGFKTRRFGVTNVELAGHPLEGSSILRPSMKITPKILILSMFSSEAEVWYKKMPSLTDQYVVVDGLSPLFPEVYCNNKGDVCQVTLGEGEINAASSMTALVFSDKFDLRKTYILAAAVAGINPRLATTGSATFAQYAVQFDLQLELDARQIPKNAPSGYLPQFTRFPKKGGGVEYPTAVYGTEAFELNQNLRDRFITLARTNRLKDSDTARKYRKKYNYAPANQPPGVVGCATGTSNVFWSGSFLEQAFSVYAKLLTNGTGTYCASQQEDNAFLEVLIRGNKAGRVDFARVAIMRTGSDFDRAPPGVSEAYHFLRAEQGGFPIALENIYVAGHPIIMDVLRKWDYVYKEGIKPSNYIGDLFNTLGRQNPDIG